MRSTRYELIDFDVWGNAREGFWVNQAFRTGKFVVIPDDAKDREIVHLLKQAGMIKKTARTSSVKIDGETGHSLYFEHAPTSRPEFELRAVDED